MKTIETMLVDYYTGVKYRGTHRDVHYEVCAHAFKQELDRQWDFPCGWATYVLMSEEQHEKFKPRLDSAPWNGGQTYYRKITEEHIDVSSELAEKWNKPYWKMGDDFMHLWDHNLFDVYDRRYMERHICRVIDYLIDGSSDDETK